MDSKEATLVGPDPCLGDPSASYCYPPEEIYHTIPYHMALAGSKRDFMGVATTSDIPHPKNITLNPQFDVQAMGMDVQMDVTNDDSIDPIEAMEAEAIEGMLSDQFDVQAMGMDVQMDVTNDDSINPIEAMEAEAIEGMLSDDQSMSSSSISTSTPDQYGHVGINLSPPDSFPPLPFDAKASFPDTQAPVFLGVEQQAPDDPLIPSLGQVMCYLFLLDPIDWVCTKTNLIKRLGMLKLIPVSHHPEAHSAFTELETHMYDGQPSIVDKWLQEFQILLSTLILGTPPNADQKDFMKHYGLPMETWVHYVSRLTCQDVDEEQVRKVTTMDKYFDMMVFFTRMAHTPPECLFPIAN